MKIVVKTVPEPMENILPKKGFLEKIAGHFKSAPKNEKPLVRIKPLQIKLDSNEEKVVVENAELIKEDQGLLPTPPSAPKRVKELAGKFDVFKSALSSGAKKFNSSNAASMKAKGISSYFLRMPISEQVIFAKRLAILFKAGVPVLSALEMLKNQAATKSGKYILGHLKEQVENGQSLSAGMGKFKKVFGDFAVNIVRVGEVSGNLNENLHYLADELKKKQELKRKIVGALIYPIFIVVATIGITVLLTVYVFPKIMPIFQSFKTALPVSTRILIFASNTLQHYGLYVFLAGLILAGLIAYLLSKRSIRLWFDRNILRIPILGNMFKCYQISNFTRTLGLLIKSDVRIVEALNIVSSTIGNAAYKQAFEGLAEGATRGEKTSVIMETDILLFPSVVYQMTSVGEATGNLSSSLLYLAEMHEDELNDITKNLSTSIEPVLMIFMGILVGFIAISIITPIYGITQSLHP